MNQLKILECIDIISKGREEILAMQKPESRNETFTALFLFHLHSLELMNDVLFSERDADFEQNLHILRSHILSGVNDLLDYIPVKPPKNIKV